MMVHRFYRKAQVGLAILGLLPKPNLLGDRNVEWSWVAAHLGDGSGEALDFGSGGTLLGLLAARRGYRVTAIDLQEVSGWYRHERFQGLQGDLFNFTVPPHTYDLVISCSTIEHVGLSHRYGVRHDRPTGDFEAMAQLRRLLKPSGRMLLTIPVGADAVFPPLHRVYGPQRLPKLLEGWRVREEEYWIKDAQNHWVAADQGTALSTRPSAWRYGLGLFALVPMPEGQP